MKNKLVLAKIIFLALFFAQSVLLHARFEQEIITLTSETLPLEERVAAAKSCFGEGPLDQNVLAALFDSIETQRPGTLEGGEDEMTPFYSHPFWALLVDKEESLPQFLSGALISEGDTLHNSLCVQGLRELKSRGYDATEQLNIWATKTNDPKQSQRIQKLLQDLAERPVLSKRPTPQYLEPAPPPDRMLELMKARKLAREQGRPTPASTAEIQRPTLKHAPPSEESIPPGVDVPPSRLRQAPEAKPSPPTSLPSGEPSSSAPWVIVVASIAAAIGLLVLLLKRRS